MSADFKFITAGPPDWGWAVEARGTPEEIAALRKGARVGVKLKGGSYREVQLRERVSVSANGRRAIYKVVDWRG